MDDEEILKRLGATARNQEARAEADPDARWDALAAGTLQPEALQQLREDAGEDAEQLESLFRPLSDEFRRKQAENGAAAMRSSAASGTETRLRVWRWRRPVLSAAALAASFALVWLWQGSKDPVDLPAYYLETQGHDQPLRGDHAAARSTVATYSPGARLDWILRPESSHSADIAVRVWLSSGQHRRPWPMHVHAAASGSVRLTGVVGDSLPNPLGVHEIVVQIAERGISWETASDDALPGVQSFHRSVRFIQGAPR